MTQNPALSSPRVLLVFPNTSNEGVVSLAVGILSAIAKKAGWEVDYFETSFYRKRGTAGEERERSGEFKAIDREQAFDLLPHERLRADFIERLARFRPDVLAVTANSLEFDLFAELVEGLNRGAEKPFVIVGGCHATIAPDDVIAHPWVDAVCVGEGEQAWEEFLGRFAAGGQVQSIRNLWVKTAAGVRKNPLRPLLGADALWATPVDLRFFGERHFRKPFDGKLYRRGMIELSRGCPYRCTYCVNSALQDIYKGLGRWLRLRPFENFQEGVRRLVECGCEMLQLQDECFFSVSREVLERFCEWYGREIRLPLLLQTRPETVTEDKIRRVAGMNVLVQISLGVESGSPRVLREICHRRMTLDQIRRAFALIRQYGLRSNAYTMIGLPTETRAEAFQTIRLIREIRPTVSIMSVFYPFRGVPLRRTCVENGYITGDEKARTFTDVSILRDQPMSPEEIHNLRRTYSLYTRLPEEYFPQIELCERDYEGHGQLFDSLVALSWKRRG